MSNQPQTPEKPDSSDKLKAFLAGAIVAASALVGGLAVVLWNRKALSGLRQPPGAGKNTTIEPDNVED